MPHNYILFSASLNKYYIGSTTHLWIRIDEHNAGKTPSTRSGIPWILMYAIHCDDIAAARELESKIKKRGAARFLESLKEKVSAAGFQ